MEKVELLPKDWEKIELYMRAGSNTKRIAKSYGIDLEEFRLQIKQRYGQEYQIIVEKFRSQGELMVELAQFQRAVSGNIPMLFWLGKIRLGQKENDQSSSMPASQDNIEKDHLIMQLQHQLQSINGNQSKTE